MWWKDRSWGRAVWCLIARREMPQEPVEVVIRRERIWDLDALVCQHGLRPNHYDGVRMVLARRKYEVYRRWELENGGMPRAFEANWWEGWERFKTENAGWETAEWRAADMILIERFERENGFV